MRSTVTVTPAQLPEVLLHVAVVRPVFLWGAPGIGKSSLVREFAAELGLDCVTLLGTQLAPEDLIGVPEIIGGRSRFAPPESIARHDPYCLFLDELHYAAIRFSQPFITDMRGQIDAVLGEQEKSARLLRKQISAQLKELDTKEENLINLAADKTLPQTKIKEKLRNIASERRRLEGCLDTANADLTGSAQLVNAGLALLEQPDRLYRRCNDQQRRLLNQAIFNALYIEDEKIAEGTGPDHFPPVG
jgi:ATPase family protein associated with various cellular activities (AAA)